MTSLVTRHFGLTDGDTAGSQADIVVFDTETAGHEGTAIDPYVPVTGIHTVLPVTMPLTGDSAFTDAAPWPGAASVAGTRDTSLEAR